MTVGPRLAAAPGAATRARVACALVLAGAAALALLAVASARTASASSVVVTMDVLGSTELTDQCLDPAARRFGSVLPGSSLTTATGANVCRLGFGSTSDTSMLRVSQADGTGTAMLGAPDDTRIRKGIRMGGVATDGALVAYAIEFQDDGVYRTADGGSTWTTSTQPLSGGNHNSLDVIDGTTTLLAARQFGRITRSTDGGDTWSNIDTPASATSTGLSEVAAPSVNAAYAVGDADTVLKSTDAGASWSTVAVPTTGHDFDAVSAPTDTDVFVIAENGDLLRSTNGGSSWATTDVSAVDLDDVSAPNPSDVWVTGDGGAVHRSDDGGVSFTDVSPGGGISSGYTIHAIDGLTAWVGGTGTAQMTVDGGATWTPLTTASQSIVIDIDSDDGTHVYMGHHAQTVSLSQDGGGTWTQPVNEGADLYGVWSPDGKEIVTTGTHGRIERSTDGGTTWTSTYATGTDGILEDVEIEGDTGWAVIDEVPGLVVGTTDGGLTWATQGSGELPADDLEGAAALGDGRGIAVGDLGIAASTSNGGATWVTRTSNTPENLLDVAGNSSGFAVAVGYNGTIITSDDHGETWTVQASGTPEDLEAVDVVDSQQAWAAGDNGTVLRTDDGGASWQSVGTGSASDDFRMVSAPARDVAWVARSIWGASDVRRTHDGGATWEQFALGSAARELVAIDGETLVTAGMNNDVHLSTGTTPLADFAPASQDWTAGTGMFGACLQAVGGSAAPVDWPIDSGNTAGLCEADNGDDWQPLATTPETLASTAVAGDSGTVDLVWGVRVPDAMAPGSYSAGVRIEVLAPAVP